MGPARRGSTTRSNRPVVLSRTLRATFEPSGESARPPVGATGALQPLSSGATSDPSRDTETTSAAPPVVVPPRTYSIVPSRPRATSPMPARTDTDGPASSSLPRSKAAA